MRFGGRGPDRLLTLGAVLGGAVLLAVALGAVLGIRPVFLRSGSMAPTMPTGTFALVREVPASALQVGDVVCVTADGGARVTHRITSIDRSGPVTVLRLQGDANRTPDAQPYAVHDTYRVIGHVPWVGYLVGGLGSPFGLVALGALVCGLVLLLVRGGPPPDDRRPGRRRAPKRAAAAGIGVAFAVLGPGQVLHASAAPWTDPSSVSGADLTASTIAAPATFACGGLGVLSVQFTWAAVPGATSYTLHYGSGGSSTATIAGTTATLTAALSGGTAWVEANRNFGSTTWTSSPSASRSYTVAVVSLCS